MTQDRRMTLTAATAVVLASAVMYPLFSGSLWFFAGIGAVITVAGAGMLSRLRSLPVTVCLVISLVGLLLYLNLVFEHHDSVIWFIPTPSSLAALGSLVHAGLDASNKFAAPAPTITPLVFLAAAGVGITAVATDLIAVRLRSAALAGLPLLVLFTVPVTISTPQNTAITTVVFCAGAGGYLALLSADGRERIRVWGRLVSLWRTHEGAPRMSSPQLTAADPHRSPFQVIRGPDTRALAAAGRRVGLFSIVLALCAPLLVPGLHAARLASSDLTLGSNGSGSGSVSLPNPLAATATELQEAHPVPVLTYTTTASQYLQAYNPEYLQEQVLYTLSANDGWEPIANGKSLTTVPLGSQLPPQATGISNAGSPLIKTTVTYNKSAGSGNGQVTFLPAPYPPVQVSVPGSWYYDPGTLAVLSTKSSLSGEQYQVVSRDVYPSSAALTKAATPQDLSDYTQLPVSYRTNAQLRQIALSITAGAQSEYAMAEAIVNYLSDPAIGGFSYNLFGPSISNVSTLLAFLTKNKTGDCVQYSYAMTVLLRVLGIPARIAVGFTAGTSIGAGSSTYLVKSTDAHAWPEVFFNGWGWIRFEPTPPGQGTATPAGYQDSSASPPVGGAGGGSTTQPTHTGKAGGGHHLLPPTDTGAGGTVATSKPSAGLPWAAVILAVLAAIALVCGVIAIVAPPAQRALAARPSEVARRRLRLSSGTALIALGVAAVVAIALYRLLAHTSGLDLGSGWATVGIAFGAACVLGLTAPMACRAVLRRWRWMRADDDESRAHAAWEELRADLADHGIGFLPSESPRALAGRVTGNSGLALAEPAVEAVGRIALAEEYATYAGRPPESEGLRQDGSVARRGLAAAAGPGTRWRARLFPTSMMNALADSTAKLQETWATRIRRRR
jgi:transglutaminase-like putative cysteine protease